jgi:hypothetical protein
MAAQNGALPRATAGLGKLSFPGGNDNRRYPTKNTAVQEQSKARLNYLAQAAPSPRAGVAVPFPRRDRSRRGLAKPARNRCRAPCRVHPRLRRRRVLAGRPSRAGRTVMIDFETINRAALSALPAVLARIVSSGKIVAGEYVVRNSARDDRRPGSFKINMRTGWWCDFAPVAAVAAYERVRGAG